MCPFSAKSDRDSHASRVENAENLLAALSPPPPVEPIQRRISNRHFFAGGEANYFGKRNG
jgi:hypothetical protein